MNLIKYINKNLVNIPGWRTNRKIVVIESDDWGSIRMPSNKIYQKLLKAGIRVDKCHYCKYDSIASEKDLSLLFELLTSVKDQNGNSTIITANAVVANPDFEKIKASNFTNYSYKIITETFKDFKGCENSFDYWREGQKYGCFKIQSHGREHVNVSRWMHSLKENNKETKFAFDMGVYGISTTITSEKRKSFLPAFDFETHQEENSVNLIAKDGLDIFEEIFGFRSKSFIASNYIWGKSLEDTLADCGVAYIQGSQTHSYSLLNGQKSKKRIRYIGRKNKNGQIDIARNVHFEPSENPQKDWVNYCLKAIDFAFKWGKPAIISSHRVNFIGALDENNRDKNLRLLKELLIEIIKRWPNVEFMSSDQLGELISQNKKV